MIRSMAKERSLKPNKIKFLFWFLLFIVFFSFSIYMIFFYPGIDGKVMGGGVSLLISAGLFFLLYKAPIWKATLILNRKGIFLNNVPKQNCRFVYWSNIRSIGKFRQRFLLPKFPYLWRQDYLVIYLNSSTGDFSNDKQNFLFGKRYKEMKQGRQILIPVNFLPYYSINKNLKIFKEYSVKVGE